MSELIELAVTKEQAQIWVDEVRRGLSNVRYYLLKIRDTKAFEALDYNSFEDFGKAEFGYEKTQLYQLAKAAEIEKSLDSAMAEKSIPERHLRPLTKIPEDERQAIWDEANKKAELAGKERTAKMVEEAVSAYIHKLKNADEVINEAEKLLKYATREQESWRQQFMDERNSKRDLQTELFEVKASKKETIYIDNSTKALEQYKEETEQKLFKLKQELKATQDQQLKDRDKASQEVNRILALI